MPYDIAVFLDEQGATGNLDEKGEIAVYQKNQGQWTELRVKEFVFDKSAGLQGLRNKMAEVLEFLGDCRVFVALTVTGVAYFSLEKAGCSLWEFEGRPAEFLDYILEQEETTRSADNKRQEISLVPLPVETGNGCYKISLKEIQASNGGFTSKQVLQPFLRKGGFYSLEVLCSHVPPWLEAEMAGGGLNGEITQISKNELKLTITRKCCQC